MTVRAFRQQGSFEERNQSMLDHSNRAYWPAQVGCWGFAMDLSGQLPRMSDKALPSGECGSCIRSQPCKPPIHPLKPAPGIPAHAPQCINRWLSVRLELLGISVVFGTAVLVAVAAPRSAGLAGLALTSALSLTGCALLSNVLSNVLHFSMVHAVCSWMASAGCSVRNSVQCIGSPPAASAASGSMSMGHTASDSTASFVCSKLCCCRLCNWMVRQTTELEVCLLDPRLHMFELQTSDLHT